MLLIYLPHLTERSTFIFRQIFEFQLGIPYSISCNKEEFLSYKNEKICYDNERFSDDFFINANGILSDHSLKGWEILIDEINGRKVLFPNKNDDLGFDIFSASFYLLSRYEEYLPFNEDAFGRFPAVESLAFKNEFLNIPIVDLWIQDFEKILTKRFPKIPIKKISFQAILTYDIDVAFKYKGRSFWRNTGATSKDIFKFSFLNIKKRWQVNVQKADDPWDVYDYLLTTTQTLGLHSIFFFLLGNKGVHDRNLDFKNKAMKTLILKIKQQTQIGIHPSLMSNKEISLLNLEKERLELITSEKVTKSRQHYLKIKFPETYQNLLSAGIKEDYSLGYSEMPGFKAGTSFPFFFYDLKKEEITELKIFPVCVMEASFKYYLGLKPGEALKEIIKLIDEVKKVGGTFISIWHNDNLAESINGNSWRDCHNNMIQYLKTQTQN
ncbi:MAG: polysaccharide deacetylase family protein [Ginsengibacter sp.]